MEPTGRRPADSTWAKCQDETHLECHYCDAPLSPRHEHDHFPIPRQAQGTETVPVCLNCHDLKDRVSLDAWPGISAVTGFAWVFRQALEMEVAVLPTGSPDGLLRLVQERWSSAPTAARLVLGKLLVTAYEMERVAVRAQMDRPTGDPGLLEKHRALHELIEQAMAVVRTEGVRPQEEVKADVRRIVKELEKVNSTEP